MSFEELPKTVMELNRKVDKLTALIEKVVLKNNAEEYPDHLSVDQVASLTGYAKNTIYNYSTRGTPPFSNPLHILGKLVFNRTEIDQWMKAKGRPTWDQLVAEKCDLTNARA